MGPIISDSRFDNTNEVTVAWVLRQQFAADDVNSAVSIKSAGWVEAASVDARTPIGNVNYAMLSGSAGAFTVNATLAKSLTFSKGYFYVEASEGTEPPRGYALDLTETLGSYLNGGDREGLYKDIRKNVLGSTLSGGANGLSTGQGFYGSATGDIEVGLGSALAAALGLPPGANLGQIGEGFVALKHPNSVYTPGSAVVITEFKVTKFGAQNALRDAAVAGAAGSGGGLLQQRAGTTTENGGFFPTSGLSTAWTVALQDKNGDVGGALNDLSSDRAYTKFIATSANSILNALDPDEGTLPLGGFTV
jgi:hypothetical protein